MKQRQTAQGRSDVNGLAVETGKIFISYRREDSAPTVGRIYDRLVEHFGKDAVFKDVDSIPVAVNFRKHIEGVIQQCAVLLAIIGPGWLETQDASGQRRLDDPTDFVRLEIEAALQRGIAVVPVLVQGASVPEKDRLPQSLAELQDLNAVFVRNDPDFNGDMYRLRTTMERLIGEYEQEQARQKAEGAERARKQAEEEERARRAAAAQERAKRQAARAQALARVFRPVSRLLTQPVTRFSALLAVVALAAAVAVVLSQVGLGRGFPRRPGSSSPTVDAAATHTVGALQTIVAAPTATVQAFFTHPYVAARPGPCDANPQFWSVYDNRNGRTGTVTCTPDSMLITDFAGVNFDGPANGVFPANFTVSVEVSPGTGSASPGFGRASSATPYGGTIGLGGGQQWYIIYNDVSTPYARGPYHASSSYVLALTVQYGYLTFSINGTRVATIQLSDQTATTTDIILVIGNQTTKGSVQFKNFTFTPRL